MMAPKYLNKLEGKSVLVVGGSSGIGFAVAEASLEYGARVVVASRNQTKIDKAIAKLQTSYPDAANRIRGHTVDLNSEDCETSITKLFEFVTDGGRDPVDHVVETAGEFFNGTLLLQEATPSSMHDFNKTRLFGAAILAKVAERYMRRDYRSSFTMTNGVGAYKPIPNYAILSTVSGAKDALMKGLAVDMKPVRVNLVAAGVVQTVLLDHVTQGSGGTDHEAALQLFRGASLLDRIGDPEDLAETYLSFMKNYFITGTAVAVDGGMVVK